MLEKLVGQKIIVVGTETHPVYREVNVHYVGTLVASSQTELRLENWNDRIYVYSTLTNFESTNIGLDTRPTDKSKGVIIPREKVKHVHLLDESKLTHEYPRADKYVFHLVMRD